MESLLALGEHPRDVLKLVLDEGLKLAFYGAGIGLVCAFELSQLAKHLL